MQIKPYKLLLCIGVLTTLIVGNATYFFGINRAIWLPHVLGIFLYFVALVALKQNTQSKITNRTIWIFPLVVLFLFIVVFSALINWSPILQVFTGGKNLFSFWSVFLLIIFSRLSIKKIEDVVLMIIPLAIIQVPFVLYQRFFIASKRSSAGGTEGVAWDAVVGTFGGDPLGGGASGVLAFVISSAIILALSLWNRKQLSLKKLALIIFSGVLCLGLAEVKVVVVFIPLGILIIGMRSIKEKPIMILSFAVISITSMLGLLYFYGYANDGSVDSSGGSILDLLDSAFWYSLDGKYINYETKEMGRMAALGLWWEDGFMNNLFHGFLGYGPGASRSVSAVAVGEVASKYAFYVDRSSAVQTLWDVGLIGFIALCSIFISGCRQAYLLSKKYQSNPRRKAILEAISAMLMMALIMLPYSREFLEVPAMSYIVMIGLGFIVKASVELKTVKFSRFKYF